MKLHEIIQTAIDKDISVLAYHEEMVTGNPKRNHWIRIDPAEGRMTDIDRRSERTFLASYPDLTRDDWAMSEELKIPKE